jgi:glycosyltransferase involved in cell wall biosynthesis
MRVTIIRDLASEGWRSIMKVYADRLAAALHFPGCDASAYVPRAPLLPGQWSRLGAKRARLFSWDRCARETLSVYEGLYHGRKDISW